MSEDNTATQQGEVDASSISDNDFLDMLGDSAEKFGFEVDTEKQVEETEELEDDTQVDEDADNVDDEVSDDDADESDDEEDDESLPEESEEDSESDDEYWDSPVEIKIDGENSEVSLKELVKGYQTAKSLSKKGDKVAEQEKAVAERSEQLEAVGHLAISMLQEQDAKDQNTVAYAKKQLDEAYENDDIDMSKKQVQYQRALDAYKKRTEERNEKADQVIKSVDARRESEFNAKAEVFNTEIANQISDWSPEIQEANREFARSLGINEDSIMATLDPGIVKALDDYRRMKSGQAKGAVKRKAAPVKRLPNKKPVSEKAKLSSKNKDLKAKMSQGKTSKKEESDLLGDILDGLDF